MLRHLPVRAIGILLAACSVGLSQSIENVPRADSAIAAVDAGWKFDRLTLIGGKTVDGMIARRDADGDLEFIEVRRLAGKPMNLVIRPYDKREIESASELGDADRSILQSRIVKFVNRAAIEAGNMESLPLTTSQRDGISHWQYQGQWFSLESTADEPTTRRVVARIEQIFIAYRQILPPLRTPQRPLKIMLFGSMAQYATFLGGLGLEIANPAFFAADFNLVAAGSEVNRFGQQWDGIRRQHANERRAIEATFAKMPAELEKLSGQLRENGFPQSERRAILAVEQRRWQERRQSQLAKITQADRANAGKFEEVTGQMFARLYHEAFHAYLDNYVYPHYDYDVPRWLNEGLAMTFEAGQLESDTLRVDAPNRRVLKALQADLLGSHPLSLQELLSSDADAFLPAHRGGAGQASRLYEYSWGLAYYLTFEQPALRSATFANFIKPSKEDVSRQSQFEAWIGMPLAAFEKQWRAAMLALKN